MEDEEFDEIEDTVSSPTAPLDHHDDLSSISIATEVVKKNGTVLLLYSVAMLALTYAKANTIFEASKLEILQGMIEDQVWASAVVTLFGFTQASLLDFASNWEYLLPNLAQYVLPIWLSRQTYQVIKAKIKRQDRKPVEHLQETVDPILGRMVVLEVLWSIAYFIAFSGGILTYLGVSAAGGLAWSLAGWLIILLLFRFILADAYMTLEGRKLFDALGESWRRVSIGRALYIGAVTFFGTLIIFALPTFATLIVYMVTGTSAVWPIIGVVTFIAAILITWLSALFSKEYLRVRIEVKAEEDSEDDQSRHLISDKK